MDFISSSVAFAVFLFLGMICLSEVGRLLARQRARRDPDGAWLGIGVVDGAVFGLLGLVVAFTFSGAASRFDVRRNLIVEEANAIGTAYLRLDLLPSQAQPALRQSFRQYLDSRISVYQRFPHIEAVQAEIEKGKQLQTEIWTRALADVQRSQSTTMLLVPALNQMFDIATTRTMSMIIHPPVIIFVMLFGLALIAATLAGYSMANAKSRDWLHMIGFAAVTAISFYVIVDIEYPRQGAIRIGGLDQALLDLRRSMD
jgi:hypothetical protein